MQLGLVGLGKMGGNMKTRLERAGHEVVGFDLDPQLRDVDSLQALVEALEGPRVVWVMVPHGKPTRNTIEELAKHLQPGDLVIEGGNSPYQDDFVHDELLSPQGIGYVDCGVSGGIWGLDNGYGLMCGGRPEHVEMAMPIFDALRPRVLGRRASSTPVRWVRATTRRWCTTASSTASWRPTPRGTSC